MFDESLRNCDEQMGSLMFPELACDHGMKYRAVKPPEGDGTAKSIRQQKRVGDAHAQGVRSRL